MQVVFFSPEIIVSFGRTAVLMQRAARGLMLASRWKRVAHIQCDCPTHRAAHLRFCGMCFVVLSSFIVFLPPLSLRTHGRPAGSHVHLVGIHPAAGSLEVGHLEGSLEGLHDRGSRLADRLGILHQEENLALQRLRLDPAARFLCLCLPASRVRVQLGGRMVGRRLVRSAAAG